ncbi:MAG: hypothetical protein ACO3BE_10510 [Gemmobacter sp.]
MQMNHKNIVPSPALRVSLKRGIARQAMATADRTVPDLPRLLQMTAGLRPNAKALERLARRLQARPGVVRVAVARNARGLSLMVRTVLSMTARVEGTTLFEEPGLIYLRARVTPVGPVPGLRLGAVSFCAHALERLVERSDLDLQRALLPQVDAEAQEIFRRWDRSGPIIEAEDEFYPAATPGLWAGGHDEMVPSPDWGLGDGHGNVPVFSARTFLSQAEMRPSLWLRWKDDPACRMI